MSILYALFMGIVQGLTEFLPISSSGHLVLIQQLLGLEEVGLEFNLVLHIGTLIAVVYYYRFDFVKLVQEFFAFIKDVIVLRSKVDYRANEYRVLLIMLVISIIPTAFIGFIFNDLFKIMFSSVDVIGYTLIITGTLLFVLKYIPSGTKTANEITIKDAIWVGIVQGGAITPGISRSGSTIFAGLVSGFSRDLAARFSFLLSVPAIVAAVVLEGREIYSQLIVPQNIIPFLVGFVAAIIAGYIAIDSLIKVIRKQKLEYFAYYCWLLGSFTVAYTIFMN